MTPTLMWLSDLNAAHEEIERLLAENKRLLVEQDHLHQIIMRHQVARGELSASLAKAREALRWFADETNYVDQNVEVDGLAIARAALKESAGG